MVIPCLSCTGLDTWSYTINHETELYEYHVSCKHQIALSDPMPRDGFTCDRYENKLVVLPRTKRSACAIEVRRD